MKTELNRRSFFAVSAAVALGGKVPVEPKVIYHGLRVSYHNYSPVFRGGCRAGKTHPAAQELLGVLRHER